MCIRDRDWLDDARRYLTNIVGKYGPHIQLLLKKAGGVLDQIKSVSYTHLDVYKRQSMLWAMPLRSPIL